MTATKKTPLKIEPELRSIDLLKSFVDIPAAGTSLTDFDFIINVESKADKVNKLIIVVVNIDVKTENRQQLLGSVTTSCVFHIPGFDDIIKVTAANKPDIPESLTAMLNAASISTTRGILFSMFRGTMLHNAVLPLIDPQQLQLY